MLYSHIFPTPLGPMTAAVNETGALTHLTFADDFTPNENFAWDADKNAAVVCQVSEYFDGKRQTFNLPLASRGTDWQRRVWDELANVPFGTTITYGALAARLGNPAASRAVGRANATNPICLVIPCHRVVAANGALTGYAFGATRKEKLLALESV